MKQAITYLLLVFAAYASAVAQDSYYYFDGSKVPLTIDPRHVVVAASKADSGSWLPSAVTTTDTVSDADVLLTVYELPASADMKLLKAAAAKARAYVNPCYRSEKGDLLPPTGYMYVQLRSAGDSTLLHDTARLNGCEVVRQNVFMPLWYTLRIAQGSSSDPVEVAKAIYETGQFASASPDFFCHPYAISNDPNVYDQWGLYNSLCPNVDISVSKAWNYATGLGVKIALIDSGVDKTHPELAPNLAPESFDADTQTSPSRYYQYHGTHCAGILAAVRNNGVQIAGVAPDAKLVIVSSCGARATSGEYFANGVNWAWKNGADVLSCSWGCSSSQDILKNAIDSALIRGRGGKGCVMVFAAGNDGSGGNANLRFPADYQSDIIAVGSIDTLGNVSRFSSHGSNLCVCAPGDTILSTYPGGQLTRLRGTSMACPHVAGVAALVLERNPNLTAAQVKAIISSNTKKTGTRPYLTTVGKPYGTWNEYNGYGLVNAYTSVLNTPRH